MKHIKKYKLFESKNITDEVCDMYLSKIFGFTSSDIQDWIQDILDEYPNLDWEITFGSSYGTENHISQYWIRMFPRGERKLINGGKRSGNIDRDNYPISDETFIFLNDRLKEHGFCIPRVEKGDKMPFALYRGSHLSISIETLDR